MEDVLEYVEQLTTASFDRLHASSWTCIALIRLLPPLARQHIMRMLYVDQPVPAVTLRAWVQPHALKQHEIAMDRIKAFHTMESATTKGNVSYHLHPTFKASLRRAIAARDETPFPVSVDKKEKNSVSVDDLRAAAQHTWEDVLHLLVNQVSVRAGVADQWTRAVLQTLHKSQLLNGAEGITNRGFQFLLKDVRSQVWTLVLERIRSRTTNEERDEAFNFVLQLSFCSFGQRYEIEAPTPVQVALLASFRDLGLVYQRPGDKETLWYPTQLLLGLTSTSSQTLDLPTGQSEGHIIVESNFRIYAYTSSPLQISVLSYFAQPLYRLKNLVVASLTRSSVRNALLKGITANQIIQFLTLHAHGKCPSPPVPPAVSNQISLWESERQRLRAQEGVMYSNFVNTEAYTAAVSFAEKRGVCLYSNSQMLRGLLVVAASACEDVTAFIKSFTTAT